ncbi:YhgE/Pip domain-containing protein [Pontibacillus litoralis]|uniref:Phage infection protein n=1 Tax=Pontibacillus litoralis JSM 072002 TaxID=1385512 RepID=A0A0A5G8S4_9BACI|nr:YhgE/Pip domain-containing protein [Pontibacillus litoralis]KGX87573.1 phage infection protein [Pontibacillus litoralis JSM 072002]
MKNILSIFIRDWKSIGTNWVAAVLIGGLIFLPSLYAWLNIEASWDPYSQTDQLPVALVNEDTGATVRDTDIHVGNDLVDTLKENDSLEWHFTNREEAMEKLEYGDYFSVIVIPEDFSEKLATVVKDEPQKAQVEYYVNEKSNAIAPKITEKGASVIVDQIKNTFIAEVNGTIFQLFNDIGLELEKDLPDIKQVENYVFKLEDSLPKIHDMLTSVDADLDEAQTIIDDSQASVPEAKRVVNDGINTIDDTLSYLNEAEKTLNELSPKVQEDLKTAQQTASDVNSFLQQVQSIDIDLNQGNKLQEQILQETDVALSNIETIETVLKNVQDQLNQEQQIDNGSDSNNEESQKDEEKETNQDNDLPNEVTQLSIPNDLLLNEIDQALSNLGTMKEALQTIQTDTEEIGTFLSDKQKEVDQAIADYEKKSGETAQEIDAFLKEYNENIEPTVLATMEDAKNTLTDGKVILQDIQSMIPKLEKILSSSETNLAEGQEIVDFMLNEYPYVNDKVNHLADNIREFQGETDINEIIELLQNNPEAEQSFFEEPVTLESHSKFPIANYGTGMTPFYTVLSIWVGALLLISVLSTKVVNEEQYTSRQEYFGKLLTFMSIGILQTLIVTLGDIFILKVDVSSPVLFVLFGMFISTIFMTIVYTLVSVFGDTGKAMAIVLLVLQIAGSGGTYPVDLLPPFFQNLHPFLPFSYAIDLMREALGGIVWTRVLRDVEFLLLFSFVFLIIGSFLKALLKKRTKQLKEKSQETGLFH